MRKINIYIVQRGGLSHPEFIKERKELYTKFISEFNQPVIPMVLNNDVNFKNEECDYISEESLKYHPQSPFNRFIKYVNPIINSGHTDNFYVIFNANDFKPENIQPHIKAIYEYCKCYEIKTFRVDS